MADDRTPAEACRDALIILSGNLERIESDAEKEKADKDDKAN